MTAALSDDLLDRLSSASQLDLRGFRRSHVEARVHRALDLDPGHDLLALRQRIAADPAYRAKFRRLIAISHTGLFRDPEQFDALAAALRVDPSFEAPLRVWSAGCATGEEAWSLAAMLTSLQLGAGSRVLGSDLLHENIVLARTERPSDDDLGCSIAPSLEVKFEVRDLLGSDPPGGGWDLVVCRNVVIYTPLDHRTQIHRKLVSALRFGGLLLLGRSERISDPTGLGLTRVSPHLYRRRI